VAGTRFALLTGIGGERWTDAAHAVEQTTGVGIDVHIIGSRDGIIDIYGDWDRLRGVGTTGCVLVRPDRHVAWRAHQIDRDATRLLHEVMQQLLTRSAVSTEELHAFSNR
jgi:2,4-dichlorophenol 6-monooxygenase